MDEMILVQCEHCGRFPSPRDCCLCETCDRWGSDCVCADG